VLATSGSVKRVGEDRPAERQVPTIEPKTVSRLSANGDRRSAGSRRPIADGQDTVFEL
jgi:hypothetical protein